MSNDQKKMEISVMCADFANRAETHRLAYRAGEISYTELRARLLRLQGEYQFSRWVARDANHLISAGERLRVRESMVQLSIDRGHDLLPVIPTEAEERYIREDAA